MTLHYGGPSTTEALQAHEEASAMLLEEIASLRLELFSKTLGERRTHLVLDRYQTTVQALEQERDAYRRRLQQAEAIAHQLQAENTGLRATFYEAQAQTDEWKRKLEPVCYLPAPTAAHLEEIYGYMAATPRRVVQAVKLLREATHVEYRINGQEVIRGRWSLKDAKEFVYAVARLAGIDVDTPTPETQSEKTL